MRTKLKAKHAEPIADYLVRFTGFTNAELIENGDGECPPLRGHEAVEVNVNGITFKGEVMGMLRVNDELIIDVAMSREPASPETLVIAEQLAKDLDLPEGAYVEFDDRPLIGNRTVWTAEQDHGYEGTQLLCIAQSKEGAIERAKVEVEKRKVSLGLKSCLTWTVTESEQMGIELHSDRADCVYISEEMVWP